MRNRLIVIYLIFFVAFFTIIARLFYWQVVRGKDLAREAQAQYNSGSSLLAPRGNILANDLSWLAARTEAYLVYIYKPEKTLSTRTISNMLSPILVGTKSERDIYDEAVRIESLIENSDASWIPIKHKITREQRDEIKNIDIDGIGFEGQESRIYPEASAAAHLLGFVGKSDDGSDQGYFGIEGYYDVSLSGKPGFVSRESDAAGFPILTGKVSEVNAIGGVDLKTYIDKSVQLMIDEKLLEGIERYGASAGTAIVMRPNDGAILAMSSYPSYEPDKYYNYGDKYFINPAVSSSFEPGSIFKILVMAAALDTDALDEDTECDICGGPVRIDKYSIETWDDTYKPNSTMTDVIVHSDNVGMVFAANKLGKEKLYEYLTNFGFGNLTGVDMQGESTPKIREQKDWGDIDLATASFGQGIAVTPIQYIRAAAAIANKGVMNIPKVVEQIIGDGWQEEVSSKETKRVLTKESAEKMVAMMVAAAESGESKWTYLKGFNIAGKTGTAQIPISGHYDEEKTIASFVGFAPANDPEFIMLITLREPQSSPWASETAAPLWYDVAKDLFLHFGIQPEN